MSFKPVEYSPSGKMVVADEALLDEMARHPLGEMMRKTGLSQHRLEAIRSRQAVRQSTLVIAKQQLPSSV